MRMNSTLFKWALGSVALVSVNVAHAGCNTDAAQTRAASTLEQSGQGNLTCADFTGNTLGNLGGIMSQLVEGIEVDTSTSGLTAGNWDAPTGVDADVAISQAADGKKCIYFYPGDADFVGENLTPGGNKTIKSGGLTVCSDRAPAVPLVAELTLTKSQTAKDDPDGSRSVSVGDTLTYEFNVENTGTVDLTAVYVTDPLIPTLSCAQSPLPVGAILTCTGMYLVVSADLAAGVIINTATAFSVETPQPVSASVSVTVPPVPQGPVATSVDGCIGPEDTAVPIQDGVNGNPLFSNAIAFGNDAYGNPTAAVCSDNMKTGESDQVQCANRCIAYDPMVTGCGANSLTGEIDLECRVCELSQDVPPSQPNLPDGTRYCWELSHAVCDERVDSTNPNCDSTATARKQNTFIKPLPTEPGSAKWERYKGSNCYLISLNFGGIQYDYWSPTGCPTPP